MKTPVIKQVPEKDVPVEVLAENILQIADGLRKLRKGRLNDKALFLLIQHAAPSKGGRYSSRVGVAEIKAVFAGIDALEKTYLKSQ